MHHTTGFPSNWSANVLSWSNTDYYYLANHYVGLPDHGETFSDGLGRTLQEQHQLKTTSIVSANTTYDPLGRPQKGYKAYDWDFGGSSRHGYDPNYQDNASTDYPGDAGYPFAERQYLNDPLDRPQKVGDPGPTFRIGSGNEVQQQYWSNAVGDVTGYAANTLIKSRKVDEDGKITDTFTDKLGRVVGSTVDPGTLNLKTTFTYDMMGKMTSSTAPNNLSTTYLYSSRQQLRTKTSPDAGTVQYLYDKNGNLRLVKDANHGGSSANNFYQSSTIFCPYSTSG